MSQVLNAYHNDLLVTPEDLLWDFEAGLIDPWQAETICSDLWDIDLDDLESFVNSLG